jgi:hypothetical protein
MKRLRERIEQNSISTNEELRRKELDDDKARKEARDKERAERGPLINAKVWELTLDDVKSNRKDLKVVDFERERSKSYDLDEELEAGSEDSEDKEDKDKAPKPDPIRNETVRIISDLLNFLNVGNTAAAKNKNP